VWADVVDVTGDGRVVVDVIQAFPFVREVLEVGTVERLEKLTKSLALQ
jgi:hypothetical protein